ncbi:uncharacterized protein LOC144420842 [Styela clava]
MIFFTLFCVILKQLILSIGSLAYIRLQFAWMMLETKSIHVVSPIDERAKIASWVIQNSDCVETYCSFCGETGEAEWIGCDVCPRWFHAGCYNGDIAEILDVLWKCPAYEAGWH